MILALALSPVADEPSPPIPLAWRSGLLCASVAAGSGRRLWLVLDTGAQRSVLARGAWSRLLETGTEVGEDGTISVAELQVGGYAVGPHAFSRDESARLSDAVDGILGMDVLHRYRVGLDLREKTLRLWPAGAEVRDWFTASPDSLVRLPITERPEGWCVPVDVGNLTVPMVLDTGSADTYLHTEVAASLRGARKAKRDWGPLPFYDGLHRVRAYTVSIVGLGGFSLGERTVGVASVSRMVALLGRDLLGPLKLLLDYPGGTAIIAGLDGEPVPALAGPTVTLPTGVVVRWPAGAAASAPPGCAYTLPKGYREVFKADESVDLLPPKATS